MASVQKNTFLVYQEWEKIVKMLGREQSGELFEALLAYAFGGEVPELSEGVKIAFAFMSDQIKRDTAKWEQARCKRSESGKKGAAVTASKNRQKAAKVGNAENDSAKVGNAEIISAKVGNAEISSANSAVEVEVEEEVEAEVDVEVKVEAEEEVEAEVKEKAEAEAEDLPWVEEEEEALADVVCSVEEKGAAKNVGDLAKKIPDYKERTDEQQREIDYFTLYETYGEHGNVSMTRSQYDKLVKRYGDGHVQEYIRRCDEYCQQKGRTYKNNAETIDSWMSKDGVDRKPSYDMEKWRELAENLDVTKLDWEDDEY